ncbi:unnamed protein product, partial [Ascophyllum nodosum]
MKCRVGAATVLFSLLSFFLQYSLDKIKAFSSTSTYLALLLHK